MRLLLLFFAVAWADDDDCTDCGVFVDDADCPDGYRTCTKGSKVWCCDRSSRYDHCSNTAGFCRTNTSKKSKKAAGTVLTVVLVIAGVFLAASIVGCCIRAAKKTNIKEEPIEEPKA